MNRVSIVAFVSLILAVPGLRADPGSEPLDQGEVDTSLAQTSLEDVEPALPITVDELEALLTAMPPAGTQGYGLIQVGELLQPARFEAFIERFGALVDAFPDGMSAELEALYLDQLTPWVQHVKGCVVWVTDGPGAACIGDFSQAGIQPLEGWLDRCDVSDLCGTSDELVPGHQTAFVRLGPSIVVLDERYLVAQLTPTWDALEGARTLATFLDSGDGAPAAEAPGRELNPALTLHVVVPVGTSLTEAIGMPLPVQRVTASLARVEDADAFELRVSTPDSARATEMRLLLSALLISDPEGLAMLGLDAARASEWLLVEGSDLLLQLDGDTFMALLGVVGIPAFVRYTRRTEEAEVAQNINAITDAALAYYTEEDDLPDSVSRTPATHTCGEAYGPDDELWAVQSWESLNFSLDEPHRFAYEFDNTSADEQVGFQVRAISDLDCDGVETTWVLSVTIDAEGSATRGDVEILE